MPPAPAAPRMEWLRSREQVVVGGPPPLLARADERAAAPKFVLVDANKRVRELTDSRRAAAASAPGALAPGALADSLFQRRQLQRVAPAAADLATPPAARGTPADAHDDFAMSPEEAAEQAQLEQQLRVQREEMSFLAPAARPQPRGGRDPAAPLRPSHCGARPATYGPSSSADPFPPRGHGRAPDRAPVSPFAGLALSAPANPSGFAGLGAGRPPNPFGLAASGAGIKIESSPRLPSLNAFRAGSPGAPPGAAGPAGAAGLAARRPPPLSLRSFSDVSAGSPHHSHHHSRSHHHSQLQDHHHSVARSLPGVSFLHDRMQASSASRASFDGSDTVGLSSEDDDSAHGGMLLLSASIERTMGHAGSTTGFVVGSAPGSMSSAALAARSGRVCRYANCNNIARSRGLCRTHGGGKRCSHPNCNKSAQANRKCIAHGGGTPCSFGDCEKTAQSRGLCKAHGGGARCKYPDCPKSSQSKGLCRGHGGGIKCKEDGCEKWVQKNGYCIKHGRERAMTS